MCRERFPRHRGLTWRTCRDACRDRWLAVSFEVGGGKNVPGIPGACAIRNFTHLVKKNSTQLNDNDNSRQICYKIGYDYQTWNFPSR